MKKLFFGVVTLLLMGACSGSKSTKIDDQNMDSLETIDTVPQTEDTVPQTEDTMTVKEQAQPDSLPQEPVKPIEKVETKKDDVAAAKYDPMLNSYESLIKMCWSMSKKGMTINDQELADIWMQAGELETKLDKAKKKLTPEQQSRLKKLDKDFRKFCLTQPA